jgi:hypothetical protein
LVIFVSNRSELLRVGLRRERFSHLDHRDLLIIRMNSLVVGIGYATVTTNCFLVVYYNILIAYCFYYLVASFQLIVPWSTCGNWWNTAMCTDQKTLANMSRSDLAQLKSNSFEKSPSNSNEGSILDLTTSPSDEYF